jgi:hypothetical protein
MSSTLSKPDAQFLAQSNDINSQCNAHKTEWGIDLDLLTKFDTLLGNANTTYSLNINPRTANLDTSTNKKVAFGELKHFMGTFIDYLEVNMKVPDAAILSMGLRPREHHDHQPLPPPEDHVILSIVHNHNSITAYASRPEHDHPTSGVGPKRYHGFMLRYKVEGDAKYQNEVSTRLHHTIYFDHADVGKKVFISAAWVNPRLQPGPWSDELTEIII